MAGRMMGGSLLQLMAAPFWLGVDALSFLISAIWVRSIRYSGQPAACGPRQSMCSDVAAGVRLVLGHPLLRAIGACSATLNLFFQMLLAVYVLYITSVLHLPAVLLGVVLAVGGAAGLMGALFA